MITFKDLDLENFSTDKQYQKFLEVLNKFVDKKSTDKKITAIV